jgi:putative phage-type endonuclease
MSDPAPRVKKPAINNDRRLPPERTNKKMALETIAQKVTAKHIGNAEAGSAEWHQMRENRIGGSEVGAIAGESKYESAYSLWAKKLGLIPTNNSDNEAMYWGRSLEPNIINRFEADHPELKIYRDVGTWVNNQHDFMLANPDGIYEKMDGSLGVLEIKTARFGDDWANGVPRYYATQVQWYLATLGLGEAYVAVLIAGSDYREYVVLADPIWQYHDLERVQTFRKCLRTGQKPEWDGSEATVKAVRAEHPDIDPDLTVELGDLGIQYFGSLQRFEEAQKELRTCEAAVLDAMGKARTALIYDVPSYIRVARNGGTPYLTKKKGQ